MSSTGSPDPATSYSSSTPLTLAVFMVPPRACPVGSETRGPLPEMREQDCYGGNSHGDVGGQVNQVPMGQGRGACDERRRGAWPGRARPRRGGRGGLGAGG